MLGEGDQGEPISQGEVCQEVQGVVQVVLIEQIGAAGPGTRLGLPGEQSQGLNQ